MNINETQKSIIRSLLVHPVLSHKTLAQNLSLSNPGLTLAVRPLLQMGIITDAGSIRSGKVGRQEENLTLNPSFGYLGGIDARKHYLYVSLTDLKGELKEFSRVKNVDEFASLCESYKLKYPNILGFDVTLRGFQAKKKILDKYKELDAYLTKEGYYHKFLNNVESLAYVHHLLYPEDANFLLIKYGPGVGSALFIDGKPIKKSEGLAGDIGFTYGPNGKRLEDVISFEALLGDEYTEKEGAEMIMKNPDMLDAVLDNLAFGIFNAASLLGLNKIIFAGVLLTDPSVMDKLRQKITNLAPGISLSQIEAYADYNQITDKKGSMQVFSDLFGEQQ